MPDDSMHRLLGGSPLAVAVRLLLLSLLVGALMSWLDIDPHELFAWLRAAAWQLWATGFQGLHQIWHYVVIGGAVVVPIWIVSRLVGATSSYPRRSTIGRWPLPGEAGAPEAPPRRPDVSGS